MRTVVCEVLGRTFSEFCKNPVKFDPSLWCFQFQNSGKFFNLCISGDKDSKLEGSLKFKKVFVQKLGLTLGNYAKHTLVPIQFQKIGSSIRLENATHKAFSLPLFKS